jgi:hypothetical protein
MVNPPNEPRPSNPVCDVCGKEMWLIRIEQNPAGGETKVFQCASSCTVMSKGDLTK